MSRCDALKQMKSPLGAQASSPACWGQGSSPDPGKRGRLRSQGFQRSHSRIRELAQKR